MAGTTVSGHTVLRVPHRRTPHVISVAHMLTSDSIAHIMLATAPQGVSKLGTSWLRSIDHMRISLRRDMSRVAIRDNLGIPRYCCVCKAMARHWCTTGGPLHSPMDTVWSIMPNSERTTPHREGRRVYLSHYSLGAALRKQEFSVGQFS